MKNALEVFKQHGIKPIAWMHKHQPNLIYQDYDLSGGYGIRYETVVKLGLDQWIPLYGPEELQKLTNS